MSRDFVSFSAGKQFLPPFFLKLVASAIDPAITSAVRPRQCRGRGSADYPRPYAEAHPLIYAFPPLQVSAAVEWDHWVIRA